MRKTTTVGLAVVGLFVAASAGAVDDQALQACRETAQDDARLACYDALEATPAGAAAAGARGAESPVSAAAASAAAPAVAAIPAAPIATPSPEELFGKDAVQSDEMVRKAAGIGSLDSLRLKVASVRTDPYGKAVLTFENGQVWSQLDSPPARIKVGETVEIRRATMGCCLLIRDAGGRSVRVRRIG